MAGDALLQGVDADVGLHGDRYAMGEHASAVPIEDRAQIDEAARHRDGRDGYRPNVVGSLVLQAPQDKYG